MLAVRIIPVLLCRGNSLYKGKQFDSWRSVGNAMQSMKTHQKRGVDELILLDIDATPKGRRPNFSMVEELSEPCFSPITIGGGVKTLADIKGLLDAGADKVAIGTACMDDPEMIKAATDKYGSQAIVGVVDVKDGHVVTKCGKRFHYNVNPVDYASELCDMGVGEILLNSVDRDGMMDGYDTMLIKYVSASVNVPVIALGGCGEPKHMKEAIESGASAVAAGAMFQFTDCTPKSCASYLANFGIPTRT